MNMTGFEHQILNLRGLAYSYGIEIIFDPLNRVLLYKWGWQMELKPEQYKDQMIFEESIKKFLKTIPKYLTDPIPEKEVKNGDHNKSERTDLSDMQSNDA